MTSSFSQYIAHVRLPSRILTLEDTRAPLWCGDYYNGRLYIYETTSNVPTHYLWLVVVFVDSKQEEFVFAADFLPDTLPNDIVAELQARIVTEYTKQKSKQNHGPE